MTIRRKRLLNFLMVGVAVLVLVWAGTRSGQEPMVQGEPISYWLTAGRNNGEFYQSAIAMMGDQEVRYLIARLEWHPPTIQTKLNRLLGPILRRSPFSEEAPDFREAAAATLGKMGKRAGAAIPALRKCAQQRENHQQAVYETMVQSAAIAALIQLEAESLDWCMDKLLDKQNTNWNAYALATSYLHTNAAASVPRLVQAFATAPDEDLRGRVAFPLRFIRSDAELSVPVLKTLLSHKDDQVRFQAAIGLLSFGHAAKPAWNDLTNLLTDSKKHVQSAAHMALKRIDREAAQQLENNHPADE